MRDVNFKEAVNFNSWDSTEASRLEPRKQAVETSHESILLLWSEASTLKEKKVFDKLLAKPAATYVEVPCGW